MSIIPFSIIVLIPWHVISDSQCSEDLPVLAEKTKKVASNFSDLDLFRAFCDAVAAVMAVYMLEWLVAGIAFATKRLHGLVGGLPDQPVSAVVGH